MRPPTTTSGVAFNATGAGTTVAVCDENVEPVDFDTDADVVGITGFVVHKRRMFELAEAFRRRFGVERAVAVRRRPEISRGHQVRGRSQSLASPVLGICPTCLRHATQTRFGGLRWAVRRRLS